MRGSEVDKTIVLTCAKSEGTNWREDTPKKFRPQRRKKAEKRAEIFSRGKCTYPSCNFWHPPVWLNYKSESGCANGDKCRSRHVEAEEKPSKESKKGGAKGSVALLKESISLGCVSQDSYLRKSILRKAGKLGSDHAVNFSRSTLAMFKNSVKKWSIQRDHFKAWASWA